MRRASACRREVRMGCASMAGETLPGKWNSVNSSAPGTSSRIASSTASPPRIPVSQSWMTATLPKDESLGSFILHPSAFILLLRLFRRALIADVVVPEVLFGRRVGKAADAEVLSGALVQSARRRLVVHRRGCCSTECAFVLQGRRNDDQRPQIGGARPLRPRLAQHLPHLFLRRLLRLLV